MTFSGVHVWTAHLGGQFCHLSVPKMTEVPPNKTRRPNEFHAPLRFKEKLRQLSIKANVAARLFRAAFFVATPQTPGPHLLRTSMGKLPVSMVVGGDGVAVITIANPPVNALSLDGMLSSLCQSVLFFAIS